MYSKEELQAKSVVQLKDIAKELGVKVKKSDNKETIVNAILDAQTEQPAPEAALSASAPALQPRKKTVFIPYTVMKERISTCRRTRYWVLTAARLLLRL